VVKSGDAVIAGGTVLGAGNSTGGPLRLSPEVRLLLLYVTGGAFLIKVELSVVRVVGEDLDVLPREHAGRSRAG
jgi:hypothetical protein